jgi:hypothetical protein
LGVFRESLGHDRSSLSRRRHYVLTHQGSAGLKMVKVVIHGVCDAHLLGVRDAFADNFAHGEVRATVAVTLDGKLVVDPVGRACRRGANPPVDAKYDRQHRIGEQGPAGDLCPSLG